MIPSTKPGVVLDLGGEHELAAGLVAGRRGLALDDQGGQLGPGGVDGRGQAGRARSDDDHLAGLGHAGALGRRGRIGPLAPGDEPDDDEDRPDHQVGQPDPAVEGVHGEQADQGDRDEGDGHHAGGEDDDPEHDGPGGQGERPDGLVPEQRDQGVDRVGAPGRAGRRSRRSRAVGWQVVRAADPWREDSRARPCRPAGTTPVAAPPLSPAVIMQQARWCPARCGCPTTGPRSTTTSGCSVCTPSSMAEELVDVGGGAVAHGHPADRGRVDGLVGQVAERPRPGALLGLLLDHAVDQRTTGLMDSSEPRRARAPPIRPPFSRCSRVSTTPNTWVRAMSAVDPADQLVEGGAAGGHARRRRGPSGPRPMVSDRESTVRTGMRRPPPWPRPPRPGRWPTPRRRG